MASTNKRAPQDGDDFSMTLIPGLNTVVVVFQDDYKKRIYTDVEFAELFGEIQLRKLKLGL